MGSTSHGWALLTTLSVSAYSIWVKRFYEGGFSTGRNLGHERGLSVETKATLCRCGIRRFRSWGTRL